MIIEETTFESLLGACSTPRPVPIHKYKGIYYGLASVGQVPYLVFARDGPEEEGPFIDYDLMTHEWRFVEKGESSERANAIHIPVIEVSELSGEIGKEMGKILSK